MKIPALFSLLFLSFLGVTLDLFTSRVAIRVWGGVETRAVGNTLWEYPIFLSATLFMWFLSEKVIDKYGKFNKLGLTLQLFISLLPYIGVVNNILVMG